MYSFIIHQLDLSSWATRIISGLIDGLLGGLSIGLVLKHVVPSIQRKHLVMFVAGWLVITVADWIAIYALGPTYLNFALFGTDELWGVNIIASTIAGLLTGGLAIWLIDRARREPQS